LKKLFADFHTNTVISYRFFFRQDGLENRDLAYQYESFAAGVVELQLG